MVDLKNQYLQIKKEIDKEIFEVIDSTQFINGNAVKAFQKNLEEYLDVAHVIPCANGTDALQIALMALNLKPGDEIITSTFTFIATAEVISLLRLTPILVDVLPDSFMINPDEVEKAITPNTKVLIPIHLFGQGAEMERLLEISNKYNLEIIEDNAQAIGADYFFKDGSKKKLGTIGTIGCTSFFPSKNLGCFGDGGAICTNDNEIASKLRAIANHGAKVKYYHDEVGVNSRLDSIQAAVLKVKLKYLDFYCQKRKAAADYYDEAFKEHPNLKTPFRVKYSTHVYHQYTLVCKGIDRDKLKEKLNNEGIPAMIYYPVPLHLQNAYKDDIYKDGSFPVSEELSKNVISLPMHTELNKEQQDYIIIKVKEAINEII